MRKEGCNSFRHRRLTMSPNAWRLRLAIPTLVRMLNKMKASDP